MISKELIEEAVKEALSADERFTDECINLISSLAEKTIENLPPSKDNEVISLSIQSFAIGYIRGVMRNDN